jgi:hypothetical protein
VTAATIAARLHAYGLRLPDPDIAGLAALVKDLEAAAAFVRRPLSYAEEPSGVFRLVHAGKSADEA